MITRRDLLKAGGIVGVPAVIGVGVQVFPIRSQLYDVRLDNRRNEPVSLQIRLDANGNTVVQSTVDVPTEELLHLPCEWPSKAWSYEIAVRPTARDDWQTSTWNNAGKLCKKIVIEETGTSSGPVSFYESGSCPTALAEHSCG